MPEVEFRIDQATGRLELHVKGIAGPACDDVASEPKWAVYHIGSIHDRAISEPMACLEARRG